MLSVKQGGKKYNFWVFGMTRAGVKPLISKAIREHSTYLVNGTGNK